MSITVTASGPAGAQPFGLAVAVLTGASLSASVGRTASASSANALSITPINSGSLVLGSIMAQTGPHFFSPFDANTAFIQDSAFGNGSLGEAVQFRSAGVTSAGVPVTLGASGSPLARSPLVLAEIVAAGVLAIDASSPPPVPGPAVSNSNLASATSVTTQPFTPPATGALLVAMTGVEDNSVLSVSDSSGGVYAWSQAVRITNSFFEAAVFVGVGPAGPVSAKDSVATVRLANPGLATVSEVNDSQADVRDD